MTTTAIPTSEDVFAARRRLARRVFRGALLFNAALTVFWLVMYLTGSTSVFFTRYDPNVETLAGVFGFVILFHVAWGFVWYGIKTLLLKHFVGFSAEERRQAFASRMREPFDVAALVARHSERRIRIADMIGRRGRFITIGMLGFVFLYIRVATERPANFASLFLQDNLLGAVLSGWIFLSFFYAEGPLGAAFYGPQSRIMDGVLARANCLLISTLWTVFNFVLVPIGIGLTRVFSPDQFAVVFALIWGGYMITDTLAEVGGSLFGRQSIRVWGMGDVNRKSVAGVLSGLLGALAFGVVLVAARGLPGPWLLLAAAVAVTSTLCELFSPRGTDDFTMATANALVCWAFGAWVL